MNDNLIDTLFQDNLFYRNAQDSDEQGKKKNSQTHQKPSTSLDEDIEQQSETQKEYQDRVHHDDTNIPSGEKNSIDDYPIQERKENTDRD